MAVSLKTLEARANYTDEVVMNLQRTLSQLKAQGIGGGSVGPLSDGDRQYITKKLRAIRDQVVAEEKQIEDQQKIIRNYETTLGSMKTKITTELKAIRKQILVESARANPQEFRDEVTRRLREIRSEIVNQSSSGGGSGDMIPPQIAAKIVTDLKKIRASVVEKENTEAKFREEVKRRLIALRKDVVKIEAENERLKNGSDKVPPRLQAILVRKLKEIKTDVFNLEAENLRLKAAGQPDPLCELDCSKTFSVVDMHCGGEPLRIVETGVPALTGDTLLQKRQYFQQNLDDYRQALMMEPRGHADMYGAVLTEADEKECDFGVIFLHNGGYSTSCGHALLCLGRYAVDFGKVQVADATAPTQLVRIQVPCGVVEVTVAINGGKSTGEVSYVGSPSWAEGTQDVATPSGNVAVDVAYGGTYYAIVPSTRYNLNVDVRNTSALLEEGDRLNKELRSKVRFQNPDSNDLSFLYGTIFVDGNKNLTVFGERQVDRCPTGSGIQAILALDFANGRIPANQEKEFVSVTGGVMYGSVVEAMEYKGKQAVRVQVRGLSRYTGRSTLFVETNDETRSGFNLR